MACMPYGEIIIMFVYREMVNNYTHTGHTTHDILKEFLMSWPAVLRKHQ